MDKINKLRHYYFLIFIKAIFIDSNDYFYTFITLKLISERKEINIPNIIFSNSDLCRWNNQRVKKIQRKYNSR